MAEAIVRVEGGQTFCHWVDRHEDGPVYGQRCVTPFPQPRCTCGAVRLHWVALDDPVLAQRVGYDRGHDAE